MSDYKIWIEYQFMNIRTLSHKFEILIMRRIKQ
jgi:hypothetical protein